MAQQNSEFDLTVFKKDDDDECDGKDESVDKCTSINRLALALKYYSLLNIMNKPQHQDIFSHFMADIYGSFLNDYIHLVRDHNGHLYEINKLLIESKKFVVCQIRKCQFSSRHHRERNTDRNKLDGTLNFYVATMDSLHFYLFHLFECGLRVNKTDKMDDGEDEEEKKGEDDEYFDAEFNRLHKIISNRKHVTDSFERFKTSNKFNIETDVDDDREKKGDAEDDDDRTFLDELYVYLISCEVDYECINNLNIFIKSQHFDSDSLQYDINGDDINNGIISNYIQNKQCIEYIQQFIHNTKSRSSSFSVGLRFYYWAYYKSIKKLPTGRRENILDHNGYNVCDLMVKQKYSSFKEEISFYKYFDMKEYHNTVVIKANSYKNTHIAKATLSKRSYQIAIHYGIGVGTILGFDNLCALILYCDYSQLSSNFSASFRKIKAFETLTSIKKRNSQYFWWSKILRETVECYGCCSMGDYVNAQWINKLHGPFYCGVNMEMVIPSFNIRLNSPTSTSVQIHVAMKFCGHQGIVIKLDNPERNEQCQFLRGFNCSWISRYKEEDERLWFGGLHRMTVASVIVTRTKQNFTLVIQSLYYLDCIITGYVFTKNSLKLSAKNKKILCGLINNKLERKANLEFNDYVNKTFSSFLFNKQQIVLDLAEINGDMRGKDEAQDGADKSITDLIMYGMERSGYCESPKERDSTDFTNLFRKEIFELFPNVTTLIIASTRWCGQYSYSVSLSALLQLILQSKSLQQVIVKAVTEKFEDINNDSNWLSRLWTSSSKEVEQQYNAKNYNISLKHIKGSPRSSLDGKGLDEDHLLIERQ